MASDRLSLKATASVMTSGTPFTVQVKSATGAEFLLGGIFLISSTDGAPLQTTTLNAVPTVPALPVPSAITVDTDNLDQGDTYELQVEYVVVPSNGAVGLGSLQSATISGLSVTTSAAVGAGPNVGVGKSVVSTPSGTSVIDNTPAAFSPIFSPMPTGTQTSILTSPSPTTAPTLGGAFANGTSGNGNTSASSSSSSSSGLTTGAKAGIAVGAVALVLVLVVAVLVALRANKKRRPGAGALELVPNAEMMPFTHNRDTERDLAEKEMNIIGTPGYAPGFHHVDTGFSDASSTAAAATGGAFSHVHGSPTESPPVAAGPGGNVAPVPQQQYMQPSVKPQYVQQSVEPLPGGTYVAPVYEQPPPIHSQHASKPISAGQLGSQLASLHEPGMSDEELARLEDEERRLDEAIAEAERRRGSDA